MARKRLSEQNSGELLRAMLVSSRTIQHILEVRAIEAAGETLAPSKVQVLRLLEVQEEQSPSQIARFLGVTKSAVTQLVDSMVKPGLLNRSTDRRDRRGSSIRLTAKGKKLVARLEEEQLQLVRVAWRASGLEEPAKWLEALNEVSNALAASVDDFEQHCYQCGAYADGSCVLVGGSAACRYERARD